MKIFMPKIVNLTFLIVWLAVASCQTQSIRPQTALTGQAIDNYLKGLVGYELDRVQMDYMAGCKIRIITSEESISGSCKLTISRSKQFRMMLFSPLGGLEMAIYMDNDLIQLLLKSEKVFYQFPNNRKNREKRLQFVDLNVAEMQEVFWGRRIVDNKTQLEFQSADNKPSGIRAIAGNHHIEIKYKNWLDYRGAPFPKTITIEDAGRGLSIKLVITDLVLGYWENLKIKNIPPDYEQKS
jgi:hypothetical protein